jgi:predicted RNA-binding Zn-ribbon protein involved in translation (DUF1610 family)
MAAFFGPSEPDLERLRSAVQSLGTTSVPGLAAALSWRERKAERLLAHELGRPGTPLVYDPGRRTVRWAHPLPLPATIPAPAPGAPAAPPSQLGRPPVAPAPVFTPSGVKTLCPSCHVPLQSTGTSSLAVCPQCGRLSSARTGTGAGAPTTVRPVVPPPSTPATVPVSLPNAAATSSMGDRRSQELFAAWVGAKPIPCPKCRTPLRHRGVSEYTCPSCGQMVRFPTTLPPAASGPVSAPPTP